MRLALILLLATVPATAQNINRPQTPANLIAQAKVIRDNQPEQALALVQSALAQLGNGSDRSLALQAQLIRCRLGLEQASDSLMRWSAEALTAAHRARDARGIAQAQACRGYAIDNLDGNQTMALAYYDSAIVTGQKLHNDTILADAHVGRGELHYTRGDFVTSISDLTLAYRLYTRMKLPVRQSYALTALANLYADMRVAQYDKALEYYRQILAGHIKTGNQGEIAATYFNMAGTYERMPNRLEDALRYYQRALAIDTKLGDPNEIAYDKRALGVVLYHLNRPAEALVVVDEALAQFKRSGNAGLIAMGQLTRGIALHMLGRDREALTELEASRAYYIRNDNNRYLEWIYEHLAKTYASLGDWRRAYEARVTQLDLQKKLNDQALDERTSRMRVEFDAEKKDRDNRALLRENAQIARVRQLQLMVLLLATMLITVLVFYVVRQIRHARGLRITAMTDDLTGLPNRRHLMHVAEEHFRKVKAGAYQLGVLALDIDHFKEINDTDGHDAGDAALQKVASTLHATLRAGDLVGRTGGDEFIVLLPGATREVTHDVAHRIRAAIEPHGLTVSVGPTISSTDDRSLAQLIKRADEALYTAKAGGRNRVAV